MGFPLGHSSQENTPKVRVHKQNVLVPVLWSDLLKSPSLPTTVIFLIISCFFDFTIAEVFSVSLLKKAGCWEALGGEREPILQVGEES